MKIRLNYTKDLSKIILGGNSQLARYFPSNYYRLNSRNIDYNFFSQKKVDEVFILFSEQRTFLNLKESDFIEVNVDLTLNVINKIKNKINKIVIFSTCELWNGYQGSVDLNLPFKYEYSPYVKSKEILCDYINEYRENFKNVLIIYPFNFNGIDRREGFLFYKIFDSIINKKQIEIGSLNFNRDILHPSTILKNILNIEKDLLIGSGELINIDFFVKKLYNNFNLNFEDYVIQNLESTFPKKNNEFFCEKKYSNFEEVLKLTTYELQQHIIS